MKNILLGTMALITIVSCSDDYYDSLNHDPLNPEVVPASFLVTGASNAYFTQMLNTNVNTNVFRLYAQHWNETQYVQESNYELDERNINGRLINELMMNIIKDLDDAKKMIEIDQIASDLEKANQISIAELMQIQAWQVLVDTFGNIPYTEALQGEIFPQPAYDDAASIYESLIARAIAATNAINISGSGFGSDDIIYGGDMTKWKRFGASLQLKLGIQIADVNATLASSTISNAVNTGVFQSAADNFTLVYPGSEPYVNPLWIDLVKSGRKDFVAANTIVDYMNELNDPRRYKYFRENLGTGIFTGGVYGNATPYASHTQISDTLHAIDYPGNLLDYSEVQFLLAEAAARGIIGGNVEDYYNAAITASMEFWGNSASEISDYLAQSSVNYSTAPGSWKEKIGIQYWLAMYNKGFDAWTVYRRLDAPQLNIAATSGLPVPKRFTYPISEQNLNSENYNAAVAAQGPDELNTPIFWDIH